MPRLSGLTCSSGVQVGWVGWQEPNLDPDEADQRKRERADLHLSLVDPLAALRTQYDYILFDCAPRLCLVSFAALCASDCVMIPLEAADWGANGIIQVTEAIDYVRQRYNPRLQLLGYLVSRFKRARAEAPPPTSKPVPSPAV